MSRSPLNYPVRDFSSMVDSPVRSHRYVERLLRNDAGHVVCPFCRLTGVIKRAGRGKFSCHDEDCPGNGTPFGLKDRRWIGRIGLPPSKWLWLARMFAWEVPTVHVARELRMSEDTVNRAFGTIRTALISQEANLMNNESLLLRYHALWSGNDGNDRQKLRAKEVIVFGLRLETDRITAQIVPAYTREHHLLVDKGLPATHSWGSRLVYTGPTSHYSTMLFFSRDRARPYPANRVSLADAASIVAKHAETLRNALVAEDADTREAAVLEIGQKHGDLKVFLPGRSRRYRSAPGGARPLERHRSWVWLCQRIFCLTNISDRALPLHFAELVIRYNALYHSPAAAENGAEAYFGRITKALCALDPLQDPSTFPTLHKNRPIEGKLADPFGGPESGGVV